MLRQLRIATQGVGLFEITNEVEDVVRAAGVTEGLCNIFIQHTSASLVIQENADPSASRDLVAWLSRLVAEGDPLFTHTLEGRDDMPSHIKAALTSTSLCVPIANGRLCLGTWQGIFVWEHRHRGSTRCVIVYVGE